MYGLRTDYFTLNPKTEANVFFVRKDEADKFLDYVKMTIRSGRVPKAVVFGDFGLGKTHFLHYLMHNLQDVAKPIYVETPPFHRRSKFTDLYGAIMRRLGGRYWIGLLADAVKLAGMNNEPLDTYLKLDPDLAFMIQNGITGKDQHALWRYLAGEKLRSSEAGALSALSNQLSEDEAVSILNTMAVLIKQFEKRQLLILFDEIEHTNALAGDSMTIFREAIRGLVDESSNVGTIFAATGRALEDLPIGITDDPVKRRIGLANYILFQEYSKDDLKRFIIETIEYRRQPEFDVQAAIAKIKQSYAGRSVPTIETYPFDELGVEKIVDTVALLRDGGKIMSVRPTEALGIMDRALAIAITQEASFVTTEIVTQVCDEVIKMLGA